MRKHSRFSMSFGMFVAAAGVLLATGTPAWGQKVLTKETLPKLLENMGYEPKSLGTAQLIQIARDGCHFPVRVFVDTETGRVWMAAELAVDLPETDAIPKETLFTLLQLNSKLGPSFYMIHDRRLFLSRTLDNQDVTAAKLRRELEQFFVDFRETASPFLDPKAWAKKVELRRELPTPEPAFSG